MLKNSQKISSQKAQDFRGNSIKKSKITRFRTLVLTRHPSHFPLRERLPLLPFRSIVRLGSTTVRNDKQRVECNSVQSVKNSSSKLLMKQCFTKAGVKTADWFTYSGGGFVQHTNGMINRGIMTADLPLSCR